MEKIKNNSKKTDVISEDEYNNLLKNATKSSLKKLLLNTSIPQKIFMRYFPKFPEICIHNTFLMAENPDVLLTLSEAGENRYSNHRQSLKKLVKSKPDSKIIKYAYSIYKNAKYKDFTLWKGLLRTIAENENTPAEILIELSNHSRAEVVGWSTKNNSFPESAKIKPKVLSGGKIERIYIDDTAEYIECIAEIAWSDVMSIRSRQNIDQDEKKYLSEKGGIQKVKFIEFTARKRRVEIICELPKKLQPEQNPAISLNLWAKFKEKKTADIQVSLKNGYLLILTRNDLTESEKDKIRQAESW
jgi:hypothetical protein